MNDVVERVARKLCEQHGGDPDALASEPHDCWDGPLWTVFVSDARAVIGVVSDHFDAGRFDQWQTRDLVAQCRMQARENIDPEYTQFMDAVANRLAALADASPDIGKEGIGNDG